MFKNCRKKISELILEFFFINIIELKIDGEKFI